MRKQNDSIPPTLKPDSRLIDSVIRSRATPRLTNIVPGTGLSIKF
jgi:hypothetical protein